MYDFSDRWNAEKNVLIVFWHYKHTDIECFYFISNTLTQTHKRREERKEYMIFISGIMVAAKDSRIYWECLFSKWHQLKVQYVCAVNCKSFWANF